MNYKEALFFIGKCLTITHEKHNRTLVSERIKKQKVDWDQIVKASTAHYVFPALYCNLKRANLLSFLPKELVNYMEYVTDLNRQKNLQIIEQALEINKLLLANGILPIFLKGTGNLLEGLYDDIAERMVGDIDFLVSKKDFNNTIAILIRNGYSKNEETTLDSTLMSRHYPKIFKKGKIVATEIHYRMVSDPYEKYFNYDHVKDTLLKANNIATLSYKHQILMTAFNKQMNDNGQLYKTISLRNSYDLYLLSKQTPPLEVVKEFNHYFISLNNFLASSNFILNAPSTINFQRNKASEKYLKKVLYFIDFPKREKYNRKLHTIIFRFKRLIKTIIKAAYKKEYRTYLIHRIKYVFK
ncbi:conserved hypothetical protein [Tenacibaculum maritimum]|uniref:nucleotidyltransferase domain-containing protein n=1 Tax=Tenacibaculum maritimum TaxID=107401 RepID=UPI0012E6D261|nr:nucleotidyltransferase family protein [Tenacibaculum maritimum]CAA0241505.1 conserved hypothetical protein [Tenacibaculum maritimum]